MKRKQMKMRWRISLYLLGFTTILLAILWFTQVLYLDNFYRNIKITELKRATETMVTGIESWSGDSKELEDIMSSVFERYDIEVFLEYPDGTVLCRSYSHPNMPMIDPMELDFYHQKAAEMGGQVAIEVDGDARRLRILGAKENEDKQRSISEERLPRLELRGPNPYEVRSVISVRLLEIDGREYVLVLKSLITPVFATISTLRVQLTFISWLMIILALIISFFIAKHLSEPIQKMNVAAKGLVTGEYQADFNGKGYQEVLELSDTLTETARQLDRVESLRRELISNVSHDLRTPLTMIIAYSEMIRDLPGEDTPENMQVVIEEAQRLTNLVNDLLETSRLQADEKIEVTTYDLTESIKKVMTRYSRLIGQEGYQIKFEYNQHAYVEADEYKIYQVIYNLVNNAVNYTGTDKKVIIRQVVKRKTVRIEVLDSGEGISEADLPYVWDRYYKVDKNHSRGVVGSGLGLSIVRNILKKHKAAFGVESDEGKGTLFWFELERLSEYNQH